MVREGSLLVVGNSNYGSSVTYRISPTVEAAIKEFNNG